MKNSLLTTLSGICVVLIVALYFAIKLAYGWHSEYERQTSNVEALTDSVKQTVTKMGHLQSSTKSMLLTKNELIASQDSRLVALNKHIKDMNIKYNKLQSAGIGSILIVDTFKLKLHDTIYRDTSGLLREIKTGVYSDQWTTITMTIEKDTAYCNYTTEDTLIYTISTKKRGKWTFRNIIPFSGRKKELVVDAKLTRKNATLVLWNVNIKQ